MKQNKNNTTKKNTNANYTRNTHTHTQTQKQKQTILLAQEQDSRQNIMKILIRIQTTKNTNKKNTHNTKYINTQDRKNTQEETYYS